MEFGVRCESDQNQYLMNRINKRIPSLLLILVVTACQQQMAIVATPTSTVVPATLTMTPTFTPTVAIAPTSVFVPYYGEPQPARIIVNGETHNSGIGTTQWITDVQPDGTTAILIADAFAVITPREPIVAKRDFAFILELPIPITPVQLRYLVYKLTKEDIDSQDPAEDVFRWNPDDQTQTYIENFSPLLSASQHLSFSLEPGLYVLSVFAAWGGEFPETELEANYGFLLEVEE